MVGMYKYYKMKNKNILRVALNKCMHSMGASITSNDVWNNWRSYYNPSEKRNFNSLLFWINGFCFRREDGSLKRKTFIQKTVLENKNQPNYGVMKISENYNLRSLDMLLS